MAGLYIGTSGWNYKHWRGEIYPQGVRQADWLAFVAARFNTVEVNTSFYRIPRVETVQSWASVAPQGFRFAVKLWRGITHYKKLRNAGTYVENFLSVIDPLRKDQRGPVLMQLPPNQGRDPEKLDHFLTEWRALAGGRWRMAVEFRNAAWLDYEVYRILDAHGAAICLHDMDGKGATTAENGAPFVYVRRHGSGEGRYAGSYSEAQIEADARDVRRWLDERRDVFVYFNNDIGGHAFRDAASLQDAVRTLP